MKASDISEHILDAIAARRLAPGDRLGETGLAELFGCSRTIVREALVRLEARGLVIVSARRGWYLLDPSPRQTAEAFEARLILETGLLRAAAPLDASAITKLRDHLEAQQQALDEVDATRRSFLLGDFHVCLARCLGNELLAATLRDLTVRTALAAVRRQSVAEARRSWSEHVVIVEALASGDMKTAEKRMREHLGTWDDKIGRGGSGDGVAELAQLLRVK